MAILTEICNRYTFPHSGNLKADCIRLRKDLNDISIALKDPQLNSKRKLKATGLSTVRDRIRNATRYLNLATDTIRPSYFALACCYFKLLCEDLSVALAKAGLNESVFDEALDRRQKTVLAIMKGEAI